MASSWEWMNTCFHEFDNVTALLLYGLNGVEAPTAIQQVHFTGAFMMGYGKSQPYSLSQNIKYDSSFIERKKSMS